MLRRGKKTGETMITLEQYIQKRKNILTNQYNRLVNKNIHPISTGAKLRQLKEIEDFLNKHQKVKQC